MRPSRFLPLAFVAIAVAACSGAATAPSPGAPTTAPAASAPASPAPTADPVATAAAPPEPVPSPTAAAAAAAGCLDKVVHAVLYKGLKDPDSLTDDDIATLEAGFKAWDPGEDEAAISSREWFLGDQMGMVGKVAGAIMLRAGQETIEACP